MEKTNGAQIGVSPTPMERQTVKLKGRFRSHLTVWWPQEIADFSQLKFFFHTEDRPCQLWSCQLSKPADDRERMAEADRQAMSTGTAAVGLRVSPTIR